MKYYLCIVEGSELYFGTHPLIVEVEYFNNISPIFREENIYIGMKTCFSVVLKEK